MNLLKRVAAGALAGVVAMTVLSASVFAAESSNGANSRTSSMLSFFRQERTELATDSVSPDELKVFGVFLSNFMIPGKTTLSEFYASDSEVNRTVSSVFFGSEGNSETVGQLSSMLGDGVISGGGLAQLKYGTSAGSLTPLTMESFVTEVLTMRSDGVWYDEQLLFRAHDLNTRVALALALATSITADEEYETSERFSVAVQAGMSQWLSLQKNPDGGLYIDGIGNIWFAAKDTGNVSDYVLFLPACLNGFVFEQEYTTKVPLINAFTLGSIMNFKTDAMNDVDSLKDIYLNSGYSEAKNSRNALSILGVDSSLVASDGTSSLYKLFEDIRGGTAGSAFSDILSGANMTEPISNRGKLWFIADWAKFFTDINTEGASYFDNIFPATGLTEQEVINAVGCFAFADDTEVENTIDTMYYFNVGSTTLNDTGTTFDSASLDNSLLYTESLFTAGNAGNLVTTANSPFKQMLLAINNISDVTVNWSDVTLPTTSKANIDGVLAANGGVHIPCCSVAKVGRKVEAMPDILTSADILTYGVEPTCCAAHKVLYHYFRYTEESWKVSGSGTAADNFKNAMNKEGLGYSIVWFLVTGRNGLFAYDTFDGAVKCTHPDDVSKTTEVEHKAVMGALFYNTFGSSVGYNAFDEMLDLCDVTYKEDDEGMLLEDANGDPIIDTFEAKTVGYFAKAGNNSWNRLFYRDYISELGYSPLRYIEGNNSAAHYLFKTMPMSQDGRVIFKVGGTNYFISPLYSAPLKFAAFQTDNIWIFNLGKFENGFSEVHDVGGASLNFNMSDSGTLTNYSAGDISDINNVWQAVLGMAVDTYDVRIFTARQGLLNALTTSLDISDGGQFVANKTNVWPSVYWAYMVSMLNVRYMADGSIANESYNSPCLPPMTLQTSGSGYSMSDIYDSDIGNDMAEVDSLAEKQEDIVNKALQLLSTETSEYRDNWFKSMVDSWVISAHKSVIGTYTNSGLTQNLGVETGSTTYSSVTGYISTPQLTDISATTWIIEQYGVIYVMLMLVALIYCFAMIITGGKTLKEGVLTLCILAVILVFPQVLLNNSIGLMNAAGDAMYSERFNFWAITKHQSSINALADASSKSVGDYIVASNIQMAQDAYSTDQGVRIKWNSPKKQSAFDAMFSTNISNENSTVNLTIFKTLFNSFFNQEEYVYDNFATYLYRPYNAIAGEASGYYTGLISLYSADKITVSTGISNGLAILDRKYDGDYYQSYWSKRADYNKVNDVELMAEGTTNVPSQAKVDPNVALAALANTSITDLITYDGWENSADASMEKGLDVSKLTDSAALQLYFGYSESEFYYFYNVLKSQWAEISNSANTSVASTGSAMKFKNAMLEAGLFETNTEVGANMQVRDYLGLEYLFNYVIPYMSRGNDYVTMYDRYYGLDVSDYDFTNEDAIKANASEGGVESGQVDAAGNPIYVNNEYAVAKAKKEEVSNVWMLYSAWVDQLSEATPYESVMGSETFDPLEPVAYRETLGRDMVFGKAALEKAGMDVSSLSSVEQKIIAVLDATYEDIMYLNNYWNYDSEVLVTMAAMMATFNFNREFSKFALIGDSNIVYPQNFELKNFNYDAFLRLIIMNSTGESLVDTTDLYTRVIGKTSVFTGILLLLVDITAVIGIPALKFVILLLLLITGLIMCMTCIVCSLKEVPKKLWTCLLSPMLIFAVATVLFAWVVSLFVGTGLSSYVGASSYSIATNDPTITFLLMLLVNVLYIVVLVKLFFKMFKTLKTEVKAAGLVMTGVVAGAAAVIGRNVVAGVRSFGSGNAQGTGAIRGNRGSRNSDSIDDEGSVTSRVGGTSSSSREGAGSREGIGIGIGSRSRSGSPLLANDMHAQEEQSADTSLTAKKLGTDTGASVGAEAKSAPVEKPKPADRVSGGSIKVEGKPKESLASKVATTYASASDRIARARTAQKNFVTDVRTRCKDVADSAKTKVNYVRDGGLYRDTYMKANEVKDKAVELQRNVKDRAVEIKDNVQREVNAKVQDAKGQFGAAQELSNEAKAVSAQKVAEYKVQAEQGYIERKVARSDAVAAKNKSFKELSTRNQMKKLANGTARPRNA